MKIAFHTLGCKVNQYETNGLASLFRGAGHTVVGESDWADCYIVNTCTVTHLADRKSRQYIRRMKKVNPESIVAVCGCYSQVSPQDVAAIEGVDIVIGTDDKFRLVELVENCGDAGFADGPYLDVPDISRFGGYREHGPVTSTESRTRAYIKIQEGCNRFCSYCVIPYARGPIRSRSASAIVDEARGLLERGFKEIILTGINTALYGCEKGYCCDMPLVDTESGRTLDDELSGVEIIIKLINDLPGDFRIRLSSLEPTVVNADYVERLLKYEKLCHHLHLSVQSGSDRIIDAMNRHYTMEEYMEIVRRLRKADSHYGISTDIIVGFPGETEEDFQESLHAVMAVKFCKVHVFQYSQRKFTKAAGFADQIKPPVKKARSQKLISISEETERDFYTDCIGDERSVLFEEWADGYLTGYTDNYIRVYAKGSDEDINTICTVKLAQVFRDGMLCVKNVIY